MRGGERNSAGNVCHTNLNEIVKKEGLAVSRIMYAAHGVCRVIVQQAHGRKMYIDTS